MKLIEHVTPRGEKHWAFAQFLRPARPAELFACPRCGHWSEDGLAVLKEARPGSKDSLYSVYCVVCDLFSAHNSDLRLAIETWNISSLTKTARGTKRELAFSLSV